MPRLDDARKWTDSELDALERRMAREYRRAAKEMRAKQEKWLAKFDREREQREKALDDTEEAMQAHKRWLQSQATREQWFSDMVDGLSESAHRANQRAADMLNDSLPRVYAENANRAAFEVDRAVRADTGFTLVNEDAVRYLMGGMEDGQLVHEVTMTPHMNRVAMGLQSMRRDVDPAKDIRWNRQKFASAITQGILQGESIPNIVKRTESVFGQNRDAAFRAARTATTSAENAGRMSSFERAERLGIDMEIEWLATLDGRTRSSHRALDGERVKTGERFSNGLRWPGDPTGPGHEIWNCRCRANGRVVGFDGKRGDWADEKGQRWSRLPRGTTYEQWKAARPGMRAESYLSEAGRLRFTNPIQSDTIKPVADSGAQIWQAAGTEVYEHGAELLSKADPLTAEVWRKYEAGMTLFEADGGRGFYTPGKGVTMNVAADMADSRGQGRLSVWFHEFGHHIDGLASGRDWDWFSRNADFADTVTNEVQGHVGSVLKEMKAAHRAAVKALDADDFTPAIGWLEENSSLRYLPGMYREALDHLGDKAWFIEEGYPPWRVETRADQLAFLKNDIMDKLDGTKPDKAKAYGVVEKEIAGLSNAEKHSLSDMYEGATKGKVQAGWGHGKWYWTENGDYLSLEAFAEFYSAECVYAETPATLDTLRRYLPKSYERYREILKEVSEL